VVSGPRWKPSLDSTVPLNGLKPEDQASGNGQGWPILTHTNERQKRVKSRPLPPANPTAGKEPSSDGRRVLYTSVCSASSSASSTSIPRYRTVLQAWCGQVRVARPEGFWSAGTPMMLSFFASNACRRRQGRVQLRQPRTRRCAHTAASISAEIDVFDSGTESPIR